MATTLPPSAATASRRPSSATAWGCGALAASSARVHTGCQNNSSMRVTGSPALMRLPNRASCGSDLRPSIARAPFGIVRASGLRLAERVDHRGNVRAERAQDRARAPGPDLLPHFRAALVGRSRRRDELHVLVGHEPSGLLRLSV